jgi:hypothetical protein
MKRVSVAVNDEVLAGIMTFAARHGMSRDKATAELLWRAVRHDKRLTAMRTKFLQNAINDYPALGLNQNGVGLPNRNVAGKPISRNGRSRKK